MTEIKSNLKVQGLLQLHEYPEEVLSSFNNVKNGTIAIMEGSLVRYNNNRWNTVSDQSTTINLNGENYKIPNSSASIKLNVSSNTTVTAPDGCQFATYSYTNYVYSPAGSTKVFVPGSYRLSFDKNKKQVKVDRDLDPKDTIEVLANGTGTTLTSNYNTTDAAGLDFDFDVVRLDSIYGYFTPNAQSNSITINKSGRYRVFYNLGHTSTGQRASLEAFLTVNGFDLGTVRPRSYIRNNAGHTTDNLIDDEIVNFRANDVIKLKVKRAEGSTTSQAINMIKGSHLSIEWVSPNGV